MDATRDYLLRMPPDTQVRAACEDVNCDAWRYGWETAVDEATDLGRAQADYVREQSRRTFREMRSASGLTVFRFEAGQRCFAEHRTRPARFGIRGVGELPSMRAWVDDLGEHVTRIEDQRKRG